MSLKLVKINQNTKINIHQSDHYKFNRKMNLIIEKAWLTEQKRLKNKLFNGQIVSFNSIKRNTIYANYRSYKLLVAQNLHPELFSEINLQPLAFSGILECLDGFIIGRRNQYQTQDAGKWELVPSGGIEKVFDDKHLHTSLRKQVEIEIKEELGINPSKISDLEIICGIYDGSSRVVDIGVRIIIDKTFNEIFKCFNSLTYKEYDVISYVHKKNLKKILKNNNMEFVGVSKKILLEFLNSRL